MDDETDETNNEPATRDELIGELGRIGGLLDTLAALVLAGDSFGEAAAAVWRMALDRDRLAAASSDEGRARQWRAEAEVLRLAADRVRRLGDGAATEAASASARETAAALRADVARLAEERDLRWGQVQEQATALRVVALWLGGAHHPSQPDDVAALARAKGDELAARITPKETPAR